MDKELFDKLVKGGMDEDEAREIATEYIRNDPDSVDVDALAKALGDIQETFNHSPAASDDDDDMDPEEDMVKAIAAGADRILEETRQTQASILERLDVLSKAIVVIGETLQAQNGAVVKSLRGVQDELAAPVAPKSQVSSTPIKAPGDEIVKGGLSAQDVVNKALEEMAATTDTVRRLDLNRAVTQLESGANPHNIVKAFGINMPVAQ
jgi:hypothetical protein